MQISNKTFSFYHHMADYQEVITVHIFLWDEIITQCIMPASDHYACISVPHPCTNSLECYWYSINASYHYYGRNVPKEGLHFIVTTQTHSNYLKLPIS